MRAQALRDAHGLRLRARRDVSALLAGAYRSAFRGRGLVFEELCEYQPGDDASIIEWKATARLGRPIAKRMREERDLLVALLVDASDSLDHGYGGETKRAAVRRAAAAIACAAVRSQDRVALATFSDPLHDTLRPAGGAVQLERVFACLAAETRGTRSDARPALAWAIDTLPRHALVILLSDLFLPDPDPLLARCARKHDLLVLRAVDRADDPPRRTAPVRVSPSESGRRAVWRPRRASPAVRAALSESDLRRRGADYAEIGTGERLVPGLQRVFEQRAAGAA